MKIKCSKLKNLNQEFRNDRDLKHTLIKLQEKEDQCDTAVEIIGNLEKQNGDLLLTIDNLKKSTDNCKHRNEDFRSKT